MGPRRRSRGRHKSLGEIQEQAARFNGATTKESWKAPIVCVSKIIDVKSAIPEQHRSGKQLNSPRRA